MCRRILVLICFLFVVLGATAQPVTADLSLSDNTLAKLNGDEINANLIGVGQVFRVKVAIGNFVSGVTVPGGHFRLRIGLGNGIVLNPGFNLATAPLSNYFTWSYDLSGAQPQIVGVSKASAPLPDGFIDYADFEVKANASTTSTVSFNLLISNPVGTSTPFSDPAPANNTGSNTYSIVANSPLPVGFTGINAVRKDCDVNLLWNVENEMNLKKYEVEAGRNNASFAKLGELAAKGDRAYAFTFPLTEALRGSVLYLRVKSVDLDGSTRYSQTITVNANCNSRWTLAVYPNPATDVQKVTVMAKEGMFNGRYNVSLVSASGQLMRQQEVTLSNARTFPVSITGLAGGKYHIRITGGADGASTVLDFEKM